MMKHEFEELAGYEVTNEAYNDIIEPMYMATKLTKKEFVKVLNKKAFALPTKYEMKHEMRKIANVIFQGCGATTFHEEDEELYKVARDYAKRFHGVEDYGNGWVIINRAYGYRGTWQDRGCTFPEEVVIGYKDMELERITLIA